jgi:polysaccharide export outer membrane protein
MLRACGYVAVAYSALAAALPVTSVARAAEPTSIRARRPGLRLGSPPDFMYQHAVPSNSSLSSAADEPLPTPIDEAIRGTLQGAPAHLEDMTQQALSLASKGATYSANAKLIEVLELTAERLDEESGTTEHIEALAAGLMALREAQDFTRVGFKFDRNATISLREFGHASAKSVAHGERRFTRKEALQLYYSFASRQLGFAVAGSAVGSAALCHLGRLQPFLYEGAEHHSSFVAVRSVAWHRAALHAHEKNFRAANELGVVLARQGQFQSACTALLHSAELGQRPETLANLGVVLKKLGDDVGARSMAALAEERRLEQVSHQPADAREISSLVRWVEPRQFAQGAAFQEISGATVEQPVKEKETDSPPERSRWPRWPKFWKSDTGQSSVRRRSGQIPIRLTADTRPSPALGFWSRSHSNSGVVQIPAVHPSPHPFDLDDGTLELPPITVSGEEFDAFPVEYQPFESPSFQQGEYLGPLRMPHVPEYLLRIDDSLGFVYRLDGKPSLTPYRLNVGDLIQITSLTADNLSLETLVQPDGTIVLPQVGSLNAAGKTIDVLRQELDDRYRQFLREPSISVTPITINKTVEELRNSIVMRTGLFNGQMFSGRVSPDGTIQLPALGSIPALGLSLKELRHEVELRYAEIGSGIEVTPVLQDRAPHFIYVLGEVAQPGRFELTGPTSAIQAIALAGSWNKGGDLKQVIVLRRDECWRLMATRLKLRPALYNKKGLEADDIWLRDSDIVIVPKQAIQVCDDWIELVFTRGIYGIIPFGGVSIALFKDFSTLALVN